MKTVILILLIFGVNKCRDDHVFLDQSLRNVKFFKKMWQDCNLKSKI